MCKQIFISYKAEERKKAESLKNEIEKAGFSCWMAPLSIPGGSSYAAEIENAIRNCKALVLLFSKAAMNSKWVEKEIDRAINQNKLILPLRTEEFNLNSSFSYYLTNVQFYDAFEDYDFALSQLIERIKSEYTPDLPIHKDESEPPKTIDYFPIVPTDDKDKKAETGDIIEPQVSPPSDETEESPPKIPPKKKKKLSIKKIILSSVAVVLIALIVFIVSALMSGREIKIADENFPVGTTSLSVKDHELTDKDIVNINKLKNLNMIELVNCGLSEEKASKIDAFKSDFKNQLREINLSGNRDITNLSFLDNVAKIGSLNVSDTGITDFTTLSDKFASDSYASSLYGDQIVVAADNCDLNSFDGLDKVKPKDGLLFKFSFNNCGLDNKKLEKLAEVFQSNMSPKTVSVNGNPGITELVFLDNCATLIELDVSETGITNFYRLEKCIYLEILRAHSCGITTLNGLENTTVLKLVDLNDNKLSDIKLLAQSSDTMKYLFLANNLIGGRQTVSLNLISSGSSQSNNNPQTNNEALARMNELVMLDLSNNSFNDTSFLIGKEKLEWLRISNCNLSSFDYPELLRNIKYLDLSDNSLDSFDFDSLYEICILNLSNNNLLVDKLSPEGNPNYKCLDYHGNRFNALELRFESEIDEIIISYFDGADYSNIHTGSIDKVYLVDCPLNKQIEAKKIFEDKVEFVTADDYDNYASDKITEEGERILEEAFKII